MLRTGLDPSDALRLRRGQVVDGWITGTRGKTGTPVAVPVSPALAEALSGAPAHDALMVLAFFRGAPWSLCGFQSSWRRARKQIEDAGKIAPELTLQGCRHTVATALREAGCVERTIADLLGQKTPRWQGTTPIRRTFEKRTRRPGTSRRSRTNSAQAVSNPTIEAANQKGRQSLNEKHPQNFKGFVGSGGWIRTSDLRINSPMLYR